MGNYYAFNRAILQESPQKYGPEQLAILQKMCQQHQESVTISYSETSMVLEMHLNEHNNIRKSFQELM